MWGERISGSQEGVEFVFHYFVGEELVQSYGVRDFGGELVAETVADDHVAEDGIEEFAQVFLVESLATGEGGENKDV